MSVKVGRHKRRNEKAEVDGWTSYRKAEWGWCYLWLFHSWSVPRRLLCPRRRTDIPVPHTLTPQLKCLEERKATFVQNK